MLSSCQRGSTQLRKRITYGNSQKQTLIRTLSLRLDLTGSRHQGGQPGTCAVSIVSPERTRWAIGNVKASGANGVLRSSCRRASRYSFDTWSKSLGIVLPQTWTLARTVFLPIAGKLTSDTSIKNFKSINLTSFV